MKTLCIVGPTASGKTDLTLSLIPKLLQLRGVQGIDILSADSKQVYIGQDIVTGKEKHKFASLPDACRVYGIDVVLPSASWSVTDFLRYVQPIFAEARTHGRIVLVVGGTGLYVNALVSPPASAFVPQNLVLRKTLESCSLSQLQSQLQVVDPERFASMNTSDRQNPRRLVRAIEVAQSPAPSDSIPPLLHRQEVDFINTITDKHHEDKIKQRVEERLQMGAIDETKLLRQTYGDSWTKEAHAAIGYAEIEQYLAGMISREQLVDLWAMHEIQYAKRQLTWFKKK